MDISTPKRNLAMEPSFKPDEGKTGRKRKAIFPAHGIRAANTAARKTVRSRRRNQINSTVTRITRAKIGSITKANRPAEICELTIVYSDNEGVFLALRQRKLLMVYQLFGMLTGLASLRVPCPAAPLLI
ncbi:MAG: hypothetical protein J0G33_18605 [Afipia felis]|nr:hypothetical protein [Afipia felis]